MKIALLDDDEQQTEQLYSLITSQINNAGIDCFSSGEAFLSDWKVGTYDLIILDIFMNKLTGIEVAKKIRNSDSLSGLFSLQPAMNLPAKATR